MAKPSKEVQKTIDLVTGVTGIAVADAAAGSIPSPLTRGIVTGGVMPIAATSLMGVAARDTTPRRRTKRRKRK